MWDEPAEVIERDEDGTLSPSELQRIVGYAVDLILRDGVMLSAVVVAASERVLILERWDDGEQGCMGAPFVIDTAMIQAVLVL